MGVDQRGLTPISVMSDGEMKTRGLVGFARKRVSIRFQTMPRITGIHDTHTVKPEPKDGVPGLHLPCPRCDWELVIPTLDSSGVFACGSGACARFPGCFLVMLPDQTVAPFIADSDEVWYVLTHFTCLHSLCLSLSHTLSLLHPLSYPLISSPLSSHLLIDMLLFP